ncbi:N-acylneuraminate cytidylyltransferase [Agromyces flavus]|uniref:N-acylneuraminate cytidylyltransferase n=1 Tax=Agromyces flavus TaxID=589382 RepID=A0A1H1M108_9MICO|nr:acylneuraminate cytidylyltransferase [Agromyces flavus]MCP2368690.1 N-acylneuraminate cytidylyltransferase [Agromyces flavus]GGI48070.1 transferase [Agromyces flavus]SDR80473.1 N-acylneuraminate cytidylyltransferase [Agromyces flavus]
MSRERAGSTVAIIPARGGSQGLPGKNVARIGGVPLVARAAHAALAAERIDRVVVTTDDEEIADAALAAGAEVVARPAELAGPAASSESAVRHALEALGFDAPGAPDAITVFLQATSPFIDPADLEAAVERVAIGERDIVFAATPTHGFLWRERADDADGASAIGVNHDPSHRPRRQDREPEYLETGAFYVFRTAGFLQAQHRFFGRIGIQAVHPDHAIEIDDSADLARARALAPRIDRRLAAAIGSAQARRAGAGSAWIADPRHPFIDVDAVVTDFDGVHTDDTATVDELGRESVRVSRADGAGVARLRDAGIPVLILSAEANPVVSRRAEKLGVDCVQGLSDKGSALREWAAARGIRLDRIAYLGNDRGDIPALDLVGWPLAVPDAAPDALERARHVLQRHGGHGAVRELADLVLAARAAKRRVAASDDADADDTDARAATREPGELDPAHPTRLQREAIAAAASGTVTAP